MPVFSELVDEFLRGHWRREPVLATRAGIHDHDGALGDLSREGFAERDAFAREWERRFAALDDAQLSTIERIDRDVALAHLRGLLALAPFERWARHAALYPHAIAAGVHALLIREAATPEARFERIAARLASSSAVLEEAKRNLDPERTAPVHVVIAGETAAATAAFVRSELPSLAPDGSRRDVVRAGAEAALALETFAAWLRDEFMPTARGSFAIGRDAMDELLRRGHLLDHDATSLVRLAREVYEETGARLDAAARSLGADSWQGAIDEAARDHPAADELLAAYRDEVDRARAAVRELRLVGLPERDELEVLETPRFQRSVMPLGEYVGPAPFGTERSGRLYITVPDAATPDIELRLRGHTRKGIAAIAVHEAYPGHHLERTRAADHPSPVRRAFWTPFFVEGWGLYCEDLMSEAGYLADPTSQLLRLRNLLWRAARVIVDVGLSTGEMNFEHAVNFLTQGPRLARPNAIAEARRHTLTPTQPSSYLVGRVSILNLRERAAARGWSLREFHERLHHLGGIAPELARRELGL